MPGESPDCQSCGDIHVRDDDFICRFCFVRLPGKLKRDLRLASGRADEEHTKGKALRWLRQNPAKSGRPSGPSRMNESSRTASLRKPSAIAFRPHRNPKGPVRHGC